MDLGKPQPVGLHEEPLQSKDWFPSWSGSLRPVQGAAQEEERGSPMPMASPSTSCSVQDRQPSPTDLPSVLPTLHPEEGLRASPVLPAAVHPGWGMWGLLGWGGLGATHLLFFFLMKLIIPVITRQREKKGCGTPRSCCPCGSAAGLQLCLLWGGHCWFLPAPPLFLVLYTVDVEQHFSLCFSRPVLLCSLQFLLFVPPAPF